MQSDPSNEENRYLVLVNSEEQYSLWQQHVPIPAGWAATGPVGSKEDCLKYIEQVWQDMRPRSLRSEMNVSVPRQ